MVTITRIISTVIFAGCLTLAFILGMFADWDVLANLGYGMLDMLRRMGG